MSKDTGKPKGPTRGQILAGMAKEVEDAAAAIVEAVGTALKDSTEDPVPLPISDAYAIYLDRVNRLARNTGVLPRATGAGA